MKKNINIVFCGTSDFAIKPLLLLVNNIDSDYNFNIKLVITQPDKPSGRNLKITFSDFKKAVINNQLPILQPENINDIEVINYIKSLNPDILITVAYGGYIGKELRTMCPLGAINLHPSLLPLHRGADPIRSTLINQNDFTGNTIFFIASKIDSGNIICQTKYNIYDFKERINYTDLSDYLSTNGAEDIVKSIKILEMKRNRFKDLKDLFPVQNEELATYTKKITESSNIANFNLNAEEFLANVYAYSLEPGYYCYFRNKRLKILKAEIYERINNDDYPIVKLIIKKLGFVISLKDVDLLVKTVQYEGKKIMSSSDFINGIRMEIGEKFENIKY